MRSALSTGAPAKWPRVWWPRQTPSTGISLGSLARNSRQYPRVLRVGRTRREADALQLAGHGQFQHFLAVVADDRGVRAELLEGLHQIEGEGVEIIDQQKHRCLLCR